MRFIVCLTCTMCLLFLATFTALAADPIGPAPERRLTNNRLSAASDQKQASVLVYNLYRSRAAEPDKENALVTVTNTNRVVSAWVHFFFIDASCTIADAYLCLTPNQTASFLASDVDPGVTGYIIAIASDRATGCPVSFNYLIGNVAVKMESGHAATLNAEGFAAHFNGAAPDCSPRNPTAVLAFDGTMYDAAPRQLALDRVPSLAEGNATLLVVNSLNGPLMTGLTRIGNLFGILYDDTENAFSFSGTAGCQLRVVLSDDFPKTVPAFSTVVPAGRTGWLYLFAARPNTGITGAAINFNRNTATQRRAYNGGASLHHLETTSTTLVKPVFPPDC